MTTTTLATAIRRKDWERAALLLLIGLLEAARNAPPGTIDDVLVMLSREEQGVAEPQSTQISQMATEPQRTQRAQRQGPDRGPK